MKIKHPLKEYAPDTRQGRNFRTLALDPLSFYAIANWTYDIGSVRT